MIKMLQTSKKIKKIPLDIAKMRKKPQNPLEWKKQLETDQNSSEV